MSTDSDLIQTIALPPIKNDSGEQFVPKFDITKNDDGSFKCMQLGPDGEIIEDGNPILFVPASEGKEPSVEDLRNSANDFIDHAMEILADYAEDLKESHQHHILKMYHRITLFKELIQKHLNDKEMVPAVHQIDATLFFGEALTFFGTSQMIVAQHKKNLKTEHQS